MVQICKMLRIGKYGMYLESVSSKKAAVHSSSTLEQTRPTCFGGLHKLELKVGLINHRQYVGHLNSAPLLPHTVWICLVNRGSNCISSLVHISSSNSP